MGSSGFGILETYRNFNDRSSFRAKFRCGVLTFRGGSSSIIKRWGLSLAVW